MRLKPQNRHFCSTSAEPHNFVIVVIYCKFSVSFSHLDSCWERGGRGFRFKTVAFDLAYGFRWSTERFFAEIKCIVDNLCGALADDRDGRAWRVTTRSTDRRHLIWGNRYPIFCKSKILTWKPTLFHAADGCEYSCLVSFFGVQVVPFGLLRICES
jgi:hypothetical protein